MGLPRNTLDTRLRDLDFTLRSIRCRQRFLIKNGMTEVMFWEGTSWEQWDLPELGKARAVWSAAREKRTFQGKNRQDEVSPG